MNSATFAFLRRRLGRLSSAVVGLACLLMLAPSGAQALDGTGLYTVYNHIDGEHNITWTTCGHNGTANGCWGSGQIGPFRNACAVSRIGDLVIVVDADGYGTGSSAALLIYRQVLSSTAPSVTIVRRIVLDLPASSSAKCWAGAIGDQLYLGTNQSTLYFAVNVKTGRVKSGEICLNPTDTVSSDGEYVLVKQGNCAGFFTKDGLQITNGTYGTTFFPNPNASVALQQ